MGFFEWIMGEEPSIFEKFAHCDDKGHYGEYLAQYALGNNNVKGYSKVLCNAYVPYRGKTSEIDVIFIHEKGIYVLESKNYSGWIFGSADQKNWTQCLNKNTKKSFYNPILQNKTHINALSKYLKVNKDIIKSYIIFSDRCELKKIPENTNEYRILQRKNLLYYIRNELDQKRIILSKETIDQLYNTLKPLTEVSEEDKQKHINEIIHK